MYGLRYNICVCVVVIWCQRVKVINYHVMLFTQNSSYINAINNYYTIVHTHKYSRASIRSS